MKVRCVFAGPWATIDPMPHGGWPREGVVYTVIAIQTDDDGDWLVLAEYPPSDLFAPSRFRPLAPGDAELERLAKLAKHPADPHVEALADAIGAALLRATTPQ